MESAEKPKFKDREWYKSGSHFPDVVASSKNKRAGLYKYNQFTTYQTVKELFDIAEHYKKPVAASMMPSTGHFAMLYILDADTAFFIDSFTGCSTVKDVFNKFIKEGKILYYSTTPLQNDCNSCGPITTELAMCLQGKYYLEPQKLKKILEKSSQIDGNGFYRIDIEKTGIIDKKTIKKCREKNTPILRSEHEKLWEAVSFPLLIQSHLAFKNKKWNEINDTNLERVVLMDHPSNSHSGKILKTGYSISHQKSENTWLPCSDKQCDKYHDISYQFFDDETIKKEIEIADKIARENKQQI